MPAETTAGALGGAGLYLHVPFCSAICPYCDFAVLVGNPRRKATFARLLELEMKLWSDQGWSFDTVYLGGGTPSDLAPEALASLLDNIARHLRLEPGYRLYFEANPEDVDEHSVQAWKELGVSTLSLGVQAFDDPALRFLGRRHNAEQARDAVRLALEAGFETVSVDLIFGLPDQGLDAWRATLDTAIELGPQHLSCYQLEIHQRTTFGRQERLGQLVAAPEPRQAELFRLTHRRLADAGWEGYEVSNFARGSRHQSHHNSKYWDHTPYLGIGPSAHSFAGQERWWNLRHLEAWARRLRDGQNPREATEQLAPEQLALERLMLGLRTRGGIDLRHFRERYGVDLEEANRVRIEHLRDSGLIHADPNHLRPTLDGLAVADGLAAGFEIRPARAS